MNIKKICELPPPRNHWIIDINPCKLGIRQEQGFPKTNPSPSRLSDSKIDDGYFFVAIKSKYLFIY